MLSKFTLLVINIFYHLLTFYFFCVILKYG
nr:MAG TPA: hypothetical protein [Caudoviricetes sp.]